MRGSKQMIKLNIERRLLADAVNSLKASFDKEKVLLFLGKKINGDFSVLEIFTPEQITESDYFHIPEQGMEELMAKLGETRLMLVAQIHTHPKDAFHSWADDKWAIVRHEGAFSLVLPYFASHTTMENFLDEVAVFILNKKNSWTEVDSVNVKIS